MRQPTLGWVGYNLFRVAAVGFMFWTLVVQFVVLSSDFHEYSIAEDQNTTSTVAAPSVSVLPATIIATHATSTTATATTTIRSTSILTTSILATALADLGIEPDMEEITASDVITSIFDEPTFTTSPKSLATATRLATMAATDEMLGLDSSDIFERSYGGVERRDGEMVEQEDIESYYGLSGIPRQPGATFFVLASRLINATTLLCLISAQIGIPEEFLYRHLAWLGPQSTPLFLGTLQLVLCIEHLHAHASTSALIPAWVLLGVGLINVILGITLRFLSRRLPKSPPYPLYWSLSQRLLYWTPPPSFCRQLHQSYDLPPSPSNERTTGAGATQDPETAQTRSNAYELGLADSDDEEDDEKDTQQPIRKSRADTHDTPPVTLAVQRAELDVRQGWYPTFSGMGISAPGRQVPAGMLESGRNGEVRYTIEEAQEAKRTQEARKSRFFQQKEQAKQIKPLDTLTEERTSRVSSKRETVNLPRPPQRAASRDSTFAAGDTRAYGPQPTSQAHKQSTSSNSSRSRQREHPQTSLGSIREESHVISRDPNRRGSLQVAAEELEPHFPLPPARITPPEPVRPSSTADMETKRSKRESSMDDTRLSQAFTGLKLNPLSSLRHVFGPPSPGPRRNTSEYLDSKQPLLNVPPPPSTDSSPRSSLHDTLQTRRSTAQSRLRSSLAPNARSPTTAVAHGERVARGVRFKLGSPGTPRSSDPPPGTPPVQDGSSRWSRLKLPFSNPQRFSVQTISSASGSTTSFDSDGSAQTIRQQVQSNEEYDRGDDHARPESFASVSSVGTVEIRDITDISSDLGPGSNEGGHGDHATHMRQGSDERAGLPRHSRGSLAASPSTPTASPQRPKSHAVLGGNYLVGGREIDMGRDRRKHSSIDSL